MKIGIITVHKPLENYGAALQCYGLWKFISDQGFQCEVIDLYRPWHPDYIKTSRDFRGIPIIKRLVSYIKAVFKTTDRAILNSERAKLFHHFNALISYSKPYRSLKELYDAPPKYDVYVSGSDQIWNPNMPFVNDPYFLTFVRNGKKISYSSSFALSDLTDDIKDRYQKWLSSYAHISVREKQGVDIIESMSGHLRACQVVDPTFLLDVSMWRNLACRSSINVEQEKYIFVYLLHWNQEIITNIKTQLKDRITKIVVSVAKLDQVIDNDPNLIVCNVDPREWLSLIDHAYAVYTDSFHCTIFSILFNKKFKTILVNKSVSSRLDSLLNLFSLDANLIEMDKIKGNEISNKYKWEYDIAYVNDIIQNKREEARSYLINALNN